MSNLFKAHSALFIVNAIYGANYVIAKGLMPDVIGPSGFILLRVIGACVLFWLVFALAFEKVLWKDLARMALCAVFGVAVNQLFFFNGLSLTSPINASVIMTSTPIIVLIMASVILGERITWVRSLGVLIGAFGAIALILSTKGGASTATEKGDLFILVNATSYSLYLVTVKPLMLKYRPLTVITWVFTFGLIFVAPFGIGQFAQVGWSDLATADIMSMAFVVVCTTFLAYLLNIFALKIVSPTVSSSYIYLQPILAGSVALWFSTSSFLQDAFGREADYSNDIDLFKVFCALFIFAGVYLVSKPVQRA